VLAGGELQVSEEEEEDDDDEAAEEAAGVEEAQQVETESHAGAAAAAAAGADGGGSLLGQLRAAADHYQEGWESGLGASSSRGTAMAGDMQMDMRLHTEMETEYEVLANKKRKAREKKCEWMLPTPHPSLQCLPLHSTARLTLKPLERMLNSARCTGDVHVRPRHGGDGFRGRRRRKLNNEMEDEIKASAAMIDDILGLPKRPTGFTLGQEGVKRKGGKGRMIRGVEQVRCAAGDCRLVGWKELRVHWDAICGLLHERLST
jgi:hypothetical protein